MSVAWRVRRWWASGKAAWLLACLVAVGCAPALDPQQYGEVIHELPEIEGADKEYPLPELEEQEPPTPEDEK